MLIKHRSRARFGRSLFLAGVSAIVIATPAYAQDGVPGAAENVGGDEIVVTARKREESIMKTPVVVQVLGEQQIKDLAINNPADLTSVVPGLQIAYSSATAGATVNMRGLGNGAAANFAEMSTALNIDGATAPHGAFYRSALFDIGQVEVLKGPQALFFGKSTSTGVIVVNTADPTDSWKAELSAGYEFGADETSISGFVSGPLSDKFGIRVAGLHSRSKGWLYNINPTTKSPRLPAENNDAVRVTLKYDDPDAGLVVKLKGTLADNFANAGLGARNQTKCLTTNNTPVVSQFDNCKLDQYNTGVPDPLPYNPNLDYTNPANLFLGGPSPLLRNAPYSFTKSRSAILNVDYEVADGLTFTSLSSYLYVNNGENQTYPLPGVGLSSLAYGNKLHEFSQEIRLTSDWKDSPVNFMVGALYADGNRTSDNFFQLPPFGFYTDNTFKFYTKTYSVFGQVLYSPIEQLELAAGVRYSKVKKGFSSLISRNNFFPTHDDVSNVSLGNRQAEEDDVSPEFTVTYRPSDDVTVFASYKEGYKAFGFNLSTTAFAQTNSTVAPFAGETVRGFEAGIKAQLADRQVSLTATGYRYDYDNMQVAFVIPGTVTTITANNANIRVQGFELGVDYRPRAVPGLSLSGFVNYNDTHYRTFRLAPCYASQTPAQGCMGVDRIQDLSGRTLHNAPKWTGTLAADYSWDLSESYSANINARASYSSSYNYTPEQNPIAVQNSFLTIDAGVRFGRSDKLWDVALICRNCTNKIYAVNGGDNGAFNPGEVSAAYVNIAQTRQVLLQMTVRPTF